MKTGLGRAGRILLITVAAFLILVGVFALYLHVLFSGAFAAANVTNSNVPFNPSLSGSIGLQNLLFANQGTELVPYVLASYSSSNLTELNATAYLFKSPPPKSIYLLNTSDECLNCNGSFSVLDAEIFQRLNAYHISDSFSTISPSSLQSLPNDSVLIIVSGFIPNQTIAQMTQLLSRGTSIIYVGQNLSKALLPGSIVVPTRLSLLPPRMQSYAPVVSPVQSSFSLKNPLYQFYNATWYGPFSYVNLYNGSFISFANYPDQWGSYSNAHLADDIVRSITLMYWPARYAYGSRSISLQNRPQGQVGILMPNMAINYSYPAVAQLDGGYLRLVLAGNAIGESNFTYAAYDSQPTYSIDGILNVPQQILPSQQILFNMTIFTHSASPVQIQPPHITVYTPELAPILTVPLSFTSASGNFTFLRYYNISIAPGNYIVELNSFQNTQYAAALLNVAPIDVTATYKNFSAGRYAFSITSKGLPITGVNYTITLNDEYPSSGRLTNGTISYGLPAGTPVIYGPLKFNISMLSSSFGYQLSNPAPVFTINSEYIETAIVVVIVFLMTILVKTPNRDEFYIDVPSLPPHEKSSIKLKPRDIISSFDKLNIHYHWMFMPLSVQEARMAILSSVSHNGMPVSLTYNNVDKLLEQLAVRHELMSVDGLYAPAAWTEQSKHDMAYLATFKKLRLYLVTHGYAFTDIDASNTADIVATVKSERKYIAIYSKSSKFAKVPVYEGSKSYLVFLNSTMLEDFKGRMRSTSGAQAEELKMYISAGVVKLVDADNPAELSE